MTENQVRILDGNTFVVSDERGDIEASLTDPTGLFSFDTRFLSRWVLTVDGQRLTPLSVDDLQYFETRFFLVPGTGTVYVDAKLSVIRHRSVGNGFHEERLSSTTTTSPRSSSSGSKPAPTSPTSSRSRMRWTRRAYSTRLDDQRLVLTYQRETFSRSTAISSSQPCTPDEHGLTFQLTLGPHGSWKTGLDVVPELLGPTDGADTQPSPAWQARRPRTNMARNPNGGWTRPRD